MNAEGALDRHEEENPFDRDFSVAWKGGYQQLIAMQRTDRMNSVQRVDAFLPFSGGEIFWSLTS